MSCIVTIDLDQYDRLSPRQLKAMLRTLRFADTEGVVHATLSMLAMPGLSRSTVHRELAALEDAGQFDRQERPEGGFLYRIGRRFRSRPPQPANWKEPNLRSFQNDAAHSAHGNRRSLEGCQVGNLPSRQNGDTGSPPDGTPVPTDETTVPQCGTTDSRATPAVKNLSSGSKEPSERELSPQALSQQDEIPNGWEEAAAAERRLAGLPEVNLMAEWRKLLAYSEGQQITIWRWRGWVLKARCDRGTETVQICAVSVSPIGDLPGDERQQRQARDWVRKGFWLRNGAWGPAPDQAGCDLPPDLVAWCHRERTARAAA